MKISRRRFCGTIGATLATANSSLFAADNESRTLRVVAYNVYGLTGWPKQRPLAKKAVTKGQMAKRLAMELALYEPDIVNFSESPSENLSREVADLLGMNHVRFPSGGHWPGTLLSKFDVTQPRNVPMQGRRPDELFTRHWGRGVVNLPNGEPLIVHSAHLHPAADPTTRLKEVRMMLKAMKPDFDAGKSMLLIGDLNHTPDTEEYALWIDAGWVDTFAEVGTGEGPTIKADMPKRRIDYVMAAGSIAKHITESRPLFEGSFRLNLHDDDSFALSDHLPQLAAFKLGT